MKEFEYTLYETKGAELEKGSLFILKNAFYERALEDSLYHHQELEVASPTLDAYNKTADYERKLKHLRHRLKHGLDLILARLP